MLPYFRFWVTFARKIGASCFLGECSRAFTCCRCEALLAWTEEGLGEAERDGRGNGRRQGETAEGEKWVGVKKIWMLHSLPGEPSVGKPRAIF